VFALLDYVGLTFIKYQKAIRDWSKHVKKDILFTEGGWGKWNHASQYPANWYGVGDISNPELQGRCYQAFFDEVFAYSAGVYFWVWDDGLFSPKGQPTEDIVKKYF